MKITLNTEESHTLDSVGILAINITIMKLTIFLSFCAILSVFTNKSKGKVSLMLVTYTYVQPNNYLKKLAAEIPEKRPCFTLYCTATPCPPTHPVITMRILCLAQGLDGPEYTTRCCIRE